MMLSIIVPVYNTGQYLNRCLDSILNQTFEDFELLLIDDGSQDFSSVLCDQYAQIDKRIKVFHKDNEGVSAARNDGISMAQGKYIGFVDSDDYIDLTMYEQMIEKIQEDSSDVCIVSHNVVSREIQFKEIPFDKDIITDYAIKASYIPLLIGRYSDKELLGSCCRCLYKADILKTIFFDLKIKLLEDTLFNIDVAFKAKKISIINKGLYNYCVNETSATNHYRADAIEQIDRIAEKFQNVRQRLDEYNVDCTLNFSNTIYGWLIFCLKNLKKEGCSLDFHMKRENVRELFNRNYIKIFEESFIAEGIRQKVFKWLVKHKCYNLILLLM